VGCCLDARSAPR
jgi:hypothetical protein